MKVILNGKELAFGGGRQAQEVYSTEETVIGTWIDGKPLYRLMIQKSVSTSALPSNFESEYIPYSDKTIVAVNGYVSHGTTESWAPAYYSLPYLELYNKELLGYSVKWNNIRLTLCYRTNVKTTDTFNIFIEYTKTTD